MTDDAAGNWRCDDDECTGANGERTRRKRNCDGTGKPITVVYRGTIVRVPKCPCAWRQEHPGECSMWRYWRAYRDGHLPNPGGMDDQPAAFVSALSVLQDEFAQWEHHQIEEARKKAR